MKTGPSVVAIAAARSAAAGSSLSGSYAARVSANNCGASAKVTPRYSIKTSAGDCPSVTASTTLAASSKSRTRSIAAPARKPPKALVALYALSELPDGIRVSQ